MKNRYNSGISRQVWKILAKINILPQDKKVSCFMVGLKDSIWINVQANRPTSLTMTIRLVKLFEDCDNAQHRPSYQTSNTTNTLLPTPVVPNLNLKVTIVTKMTPEELAERRKKGLCFHCDGKYSWGHDCPKLFKIEAC